MVIFTAETRVVLIFSFNSWQERELAYFPECQTVPFKVNVVFLAPHICCFPKVHDVEFFQFYGLRFFHLLVSKQTGQKAKYFIINVG